MTLHEKKVARTQMKTSFLSEHALTLTAIARATTRSIAAVTPDTHSARSPPNLE
jgi:hypothetical protein